eukprot:10977404-Alexandrium_andersonii.AAC.1
MVCSKPDQVRRRPTAPKRFDRSQDSRLCSCLATGSLTRAQAEHPDDADVQELNSDGSTDPRH